MVNLPVEGSIAWAMNRGTLFQVDGIRKYGQLTTRATNHRDAAACALYRCESYCTWVPSGTVLTVWNVYSGSIGGFCMEDPKRFTVQRGEISPLAEGGNSDGK